MILTEFQTDKDSREIFNEFKKILVVSSQVKYKCLCHNFDKLIDSI